MLDAIIVEEIFPHQALSKLLILNGFLLRIVLKQITTLKAYLQPLRFMQSIQRL